ncbi:MAG: pseudouridine synthase [Candidatus Binatia bacterium]
MTTQRVAKLMAARGMCSRREAEELIGAGCVLVNGVPVAGQGAKAAADAEIRLTADGLARLDRRLTVVLHKPVGVVSTQPEPGQTPAWQLLRPETQVGEIDPATRARVVSSPWTLSVAGRLDRASRGLLVFTDDGVVARRIIGGQQVEKAYLVRTEPAASDGQITKLNGVLRIDSQLLRPMRVTRYDAERLRFVLVEGKKHQIRRCCRAVGLMVTDLLRVAVGPLELGDLPEGCWRVLHESEIARLQADGHVRGAEVGRRTARRKPAR